MALGTAASSIASRDSPRQ